MAEAALIAGSMLVAMVALDSASGIRVVGRLLRGVRWVLQAVWSTLAG